MPPKRKSVEKKNKPTKKAKKSAEKECKMPNAAKNAETWQEFQHAFKKSRCTSAERSVLWKKVKKERGEKEERKKSVGRVRVTKVKEEKKVKEVERKEVQEKEDKVKEEKQKRDATYDELKQLQELRPLLRSLRSATTVEERNAIVEDAKASVKGLKRRYGLKEEGKDEKKQEKKEEKKRNSVKEPEGLAAIEEAIEKSKNLPIRNASERNEEKGINLGNVALIVVKSPKEKDHNVLVAARDIDSNKCYRFTSAYDNNAKFKDHFKVELYNKEQDLQKCLKSSRFLSFDDESTLVAQLRNILSEPEQKTWIQSAFSYLGFE